MNKNKRWRCYVRLLVRLLLLFTCNGIAFGNNGRVAGEQFTMDIHISGTVVATGSCSFNTGGASSSSSDLIEFGNVRYTNAIGFWLEGKYRKPLNSDMSCIGDTEGTVTMTFNSTSGTAIDFNGHKLLPVLTDSTGTISNNLGIQLLVDGIVQDVGTAFYVDMSAPPLLEAELIQTGASDTVHNGDVISSSASLTMAFQ